MERYRATYGYPYRFQYIPILGRLWLQADGEYMDRQFFVASTLHVRRPELPHH